MSIKYPYQISFWFKQLREHNIVIILCKCRVRILDRVPQEKNNGKHDDYALYE